MHTQWKPVFHYQLGQGSAQAIYDALIKVALTHKFRGLNKFAVPVDNKTLTGAIFDLNDHDQVIIGNGRKLSGQKIKELFITSIFLKRLETDFAAGDNFFIAVPEIETGCDTAIFVVKSGIKLEAQNLVQLKLPEDHYAFEFQVKEYVDFERLKTATILTPKNVDVEKISKMVANYDQNVLVYMRDYMNYNSQEFKDFFKEHPNCYLISSPQDILKDGKSIKLDPDKHNYIITFPQETMSIESFDRPRFLIDSKKIKRMGLQGL